MKKNIDEIIDNLLKLYYDQRLYPRTELLTLLLSELKIDISQKDFLFNEIAERIVQKDLVEKLSPKLHNHVYKITPNGIDIYESGGWLKHLGYEKLLREKTISDAKSSIFSNKYKRVPLFISILAVIISIFNVWYSNKDKPNYFLLEQKVKLLETHYKNIKDAGITK